MIRLVFHSFLPFSSSPINHFDIAMEIFAMSFVFCVQRSLILLNAGHSVNVHVQQADASHHEATGDRHGQGTFLFITCARVTALGSNNDYFMLTLIKLP